MINLIVATDKNGVIAIKEDNSLPWHCPEDLEYFKKITADHPVIMGSNTWFSIPCNFRPLPRRTNIIITGHPEKYRGQKEVILSSSVEQCSRFISLMRDNRENVENGFEESFIIGGYSVYEQSIKLGIIDRIYINVLNIEVESEEDKKIKFPLSIEFLLDNWNLSFKEEKEKFTSYVFNKE